MLNLKSSKHWAAVSTNFDEVSDSESSIIVPAHCLPFAFIFTKETQSLFLGGDPLKILPLKISVCLCERILHISSSRKKAKINVLSSLEFLKMGTVLMMLQKTVQQISPKLLLWKVISV